MLPLDSELTFAFRTCSGPANIRAKLASLAGKRTLRRDGTFGAVAST